MQTFLPYKDYLATAQCLDRKRLGKQRLECFQILQAIRDPLHNGWANHPAVRMWADCPKGLAFYALNICNEWIRRGYKDQQAIKFYAYLECHDFDQLCAMREEQKREFDQDPFAPWWLGTPEFHQSHRSALLRKFPEHYAHEQWEDADTQMPYFWPE